jgi:hypothetical protein
MDLSLLELDNCYGNIGKSVKVLDKVGARTSALDALKALKYGGPWLTL